MHAVGGCGCVGVCMLGVWVCVGVGVLVHCIDAPNV